MFINGQADHDNLSTDCYYNSWTDYDHNSSWVMIMIIHGHTYHNS